MRFFLLFLFLSGAYSTYSQEDIKYFRHLRYNHISPYADLTGIHPISSEKAKITSHYTFKYDDKERLKEIINNHYHTEKRHPLASIGVYKVVISYTENQEIRTFYDPKGQQVTNDRAVYKEVYTYDNNQFKSKLQFFNLKNEPMESNWSIAQYEWSKGKEFIIERRFNLNEEEVNVSPYFAFGVTGIEIDKAGLPIAHYNLNENFEVQNNDLGVASYKDTFDKYGNHIEYRYYDAGGNLTLNQWQFAIGKKTYDEFGNNILLEQLDTTFEVIRSRNIPTNTKIELSSAASKQDSLDIKRLSLGYLKALQQLDTSLMNEVMNDSLKKITIGYNREFRKEVARPTTRAQMMAFANDWNKSNTKFPPVPNNNVTILGIYNRIASVELVSDNWVEYLHLIKLDGKWDIVNLIWQHKDISRYPK